MGLTTCGPRGTRTTLPTNCSTRPGPSSVCIPVRVGYTHDDEGLGVKYDEYLELNGITLSGLEEHHFAL